MDDQTAARLVPLARSVARRVRRLVGGHVEVDDLVQAGMEAAVRELRSYDPAMGEFTVWAAWLFRVRMLDCTRRDRTRGHRDRDTGAWQFRLPPVSLDAPRFSDETAPAEPNRPTSEGPDEYRHVEAAIVVRQAWPHLPARSRWVIGQYYWCGHSESEIGADLGITCSRVNQILRQSYALARWAVGREDSVAA